MSEQEAFIRLLVAMLLGAAIGFERQWHNHYAGLRTNTLITIGSAGIMIFAVLLPGADPSTVGRIAAQVITGVGFLCAGVIMHEGVNVKGLNTAATLWCSVAVGMFAGAGLFTTACMLSALIVLTNLVLRPIVAYINRRSPISDEIEVGYTLFFTCRSEDEQVLRAAILKRLDDKAGHLRQVQSSLENGQMHITAELHFLQREDKRMESFVADIGKQPGISSAGWKLH
jgi:putative Mg2+ transporter-C (MgtC) family protein